MMPHPSLYRTTRCLILCFLTIAAAGTVVALPDDVSAATGEVVTLTRRLSARTGGAHRGHDTQSIRAALRAIRLMEEGKIPGASTFVADSQPGLPDAGTQAGDSVTGVQKEMICRVQGILQQQSDRLHAIDWVTQTVADSTGLTVETVREHLTDPAYCQRAPVNLVQISQLTPEEQDARLEKFIPIDKWGAPMVLPHVANYRIINNCIRGHLEFTWSERGERLKPYSCRRYWIQGYTWYFPAESVVTSTGESLRQTAPVVIMWNPETRLLVPPPGYGIRQFEEYDMF